MKHSGTNISAASATNVPPRAGFSFGAPAGPCLGALLALLLGAAAAEAGSCPCAAIRAFHLETLEVMRDEGRMTRDLTGSSVEWQTGKLNANSDINTEKLIEALRRHARESANHQRMRVEAEGRIEDAAQINAVNRLRDEFRAAAESGEYDPNPSSCLIVDIFGSDDSRLTPAEASGDAVTEGVAEWVAGDHPAVRLGGANLSKHVADQRDEFAGFGGSGRATTDWGLLLDSPTIDLSDPDLSELAGVIVRNALDSTPEREVTAEERLTPLGLDRIARNEEKASRLRAAAESIEMVLGLRAAVIEGPPVETFRGMAADSAYARDVPDKLSELQQLDILTMWNHAPAGERLETLANTGGMNEKAWLYELHRLLALNARVNYLLLETAGRDAIVNAAILATINDD